VNRSARGILIVGGDENADIAYATGFRTPDPAVFLRAAGRDYLVVRQLEKERAERTLHGTGGRKPERRVLSPNDLFSRRHKRRGPAESVLRLLERTGTRSVLVGWDFPAGLLLRLRRRGISVRVSSKALFEGRAIKRAEEIAKIRQSQRAAVKAMRAFVKMIGESRADRNGKLHWRGRLLTSELAQRTIGCVLLENDCFCRDVIVAGGEQAVEPHERGQGLLRGGEPIVVDIFPRHLQHGYWGDLTRTIVKGEASAEVKRMYRAVKAAQAAALAKVRPGVKCGNVHKAAADTIKSHGFRTETVNGRQTGFRHGTGHGVGLSIHEAPGIPGGEGRLRSGHVVTIEPGLYYPGLGGVRIEDTVAVTGRGWRYLARCEKKLQVQ
jgi:Xaa-Pro aminopeptidase